MENLAESQPIIQQLDQMKLLSVPAKKDYDECMSDEGCYSDELDNLDSSDDE